MSASRARWSRTASITGWGISAAPALLKWITRSQPGVSARTRARSMPAEVTRSVATGGDEAAEQVACPAELGQLLGVALHRHNPAVGGFEALHNPVRAPRRHPEPPTDGPVRLVVEAGAPQVRGDGRPGGHRIDMDLCVGPGAIS